MRYLRAFNESLESNEWYQQITWDEYKDLSTIEPFNKREVEVIKDYINDNKSDSIYFYKADQLEGLIKLLQQVVLYNF